MDLEDLIPLVRRRVRGCPYDTMRDGLMAAARTFCRETWVIRRNLPSFTTSAGSNPYLLTGLPANEEVIALKHGQITDVAPGNSIYPLAFYYPTTVNPNIGQQRPYGVCFVPYNYAQMVPTPDNSYPVQLEVITEPINSSESVPDELGRVYDQALGHGAVEWIQLNSAKSDPWYDPTLKEEARLMFNAEIVKARGTAAFDFTPNQRKLLAGNFIGRGGR